MKKNWITNDLEFDTSNDISKLLNLDESIISILYSRNIRTPREVYDFINPRLSMAHSPFKLNGMYDAVTRLRKAIQANEKIGVFSDSDIDGLTSLAILHKLFHRFGIEIFYRYPVDDESYGLTNTIIDDFIRNDVDVIITVDSGIRDVNEIEYARKNGIDVIISDHHEQDIILPDAIIINPRKKECTYPFKDLAGVGVAYKICHALLLTYLPSYNRYFLLITGEDGSYAYSLMRDCILEKTESNRSYDDIMSISESINASDKILLFDADELLNVFINENKCVLNISDLIKEINPSAIHENMNLEFLVEFFNINIMLFDKKIDLVDAIFFEIQLNSSKKIQSFLHSILELVAIGSIADVMPLINENRILVHNGIKHLNKSEHMGLSAIIKKNSVDSKFIGWDIAPILNSPGRFGQTDLTADFFISNDIDKVNSVISKIKSINDYRKNLVDKILNEILSGTLIEEDVPDSSLFFHMSSEIPEGLAGLIAGRLTHQLHRPVIIASLPGKNGTIKGSGRCIGDFNFFNYIIPFSNMFEKVGGHSQAFGFTIKLEKLNDVIEKIRAELNKNFCYENKLKIDLEIDISRLDKKFIRELFMLEPFGKGNESPLFLSKDVVIDSFHKIGVKNNHGKFILRSRTPINALGWNLAEKMAEYYKKGKPIDIIYKVEKNSFKGIETTQLILLDLDDN